MAKLVRLDFKNQNSICATFVKSKRMEKIYHVKANFEKKKTSCIYIRQSRSQDKECYQGEKRFHNDNEVSSSRRCDNSKHSYSYTRASKYTEKKQNCEKIFSNPRM